MSRQISDPGVAKDWQGELVSGVKGASERYGVNFEDLAEPINNRANEIRDDGLELERQKELELEKLAERTKDQGMDYGL